MHLTCAMQRCGKVSELARSEAGPAARVELERLAQRSLCYSSHGVHGLTFLSLHESQVARPFLSKAAAPSPFAGGGGADPPSGELSIEDMPRERAGRSNLL